MEDCIFCKIASGKMPSAKVYDDDYCVAFLDIMPANKGHCLVIPKKHTPSLTEIDDKDLAGTILAAKKVAKAMSLGYGNSSINMVMNNGKDAGQVVFHAHIHLIPRFAKDRLRIHWSHQKYADNEINDYADKVKKFL